MTVILAALVCVTALLIFGAILDGVLRRQARERDRLINQICHLAGKPWQPAPASEPPPVVEDPDDGRYIHSPDQLPDVFG
jgi:hypothetical protein